MPSAGGRRVGTIGGRRRVSYELLVQITEMVVVSFA